MKKHKWIILPLTLLLLPLISCQSIATALLLEGFRDAGFSHSFIKAKEKELKENEKSYEDEYSKEYKADKKTNAIRTQFEDGITITYDNPDALNETMKYQLNSAIKMNVYKETNQKVYLSDSVHTKYRAELEITPKPGTSDNIEEITIVFYVYGKYKRVYSVQSAYKMNDEEKEIPYENICNIVSGYVLMALKNEL